MLRYIRLVWIVLTPHGVYTNWEKGETTEQSGTYSKCGDQHNFHYSVRPFDVANRYISCGISALSEMASRKDDRWKRIYFAKDSWTMQSRALRVGHLLGLHDITGSSKVTDCFKLLKVALTTRVTCNKPYC
jgi:hypothetical protein